MQGMDGALKGAEVDVIILREVTQGDLTVEDIVFEGQGPLEDVIRMAWGKLGAYRCQHPKKALDQSEDERTERRTKGGAREERTALAASAGDLAALAALAPSPD